MLHLVRAPRGAFATFLLLALSLPASHVAAQPASPRQQAYEEAAAAHGVPVRVLLAVSYMQSRWDDHAGTPSTVGGYGPMHLTEAARFLGEGHHHAGDEDPRGDEARPRRVRAPLDPHALPESMRTLEAAAFLTGVDTDTLRRDPAANIRGGAAVLARYQRELGAPLSAEPRDWYGAVARYGGGTDARAAARYADDVYARLGEGAERLADDGSRVTLPPTRVAPDSAWLARLALPAPPPSGQVECPDELACAWVPAPYTQFVEAGTLDYGNHDKAQRSGAQKVEYIVIHDTEGAYDTALRLVQDPAYVSWHYTLRSSDGQVAQHVKTADVAWHAGNWYVNSKAIGIEHEGFAAQGTWYTEAMYQASARLVRHLAALHQIPLDRAHILGHDNVPGILPANVRGMHWDPGPYWDWAHYFELLGAPLEATSTSDSGMVTLLPPFEANRPALVGCDAAVPGAVCPSRGTSTVVLRTAPADDAPLIRDVGMRGDAPSTMQVSDHGARASTGQQYAVAAVRGPWTAIWVLGQVAWFANPASRPTAVRARGVLATPRSGVASIPVYGRAYPESAAYPDGVPVQTVTPLQYAWPAGQSYVVGPTLRPEYYRSSTFDGSSPADWTVIAGDDTYLQVQFGHRIMYVRAADVVTREVGD